MAFVITRLCADSRGKVCDEECRSVCPVEGIGPRPGEADYYSVDQLFIDPYECIECNACAGICPVEAIYPETELPTEWLPWIEKNEDFYDKRAVPVSA